MNRTMAVAHKNKTFATFLAAFLGAAGLHRFYLAGFRDFWGWAHLLATFLGLLLFLAGGNRPAFFSLMPAILSGIVAIIEALVIGLTPDDKWDARHNAGSGRRSDSRWPLAVLLVFTVGAGAIAVIGTLARTFDLLFTGGSFG